MKTAILALGHGGGVPGVIPSTALGGSAGNTNFAIVPNAHFSQIDTEMVCS